MSYTALKNRQTKMARLAVGDISPMIVIILFLLFVPAGAERHVGGIHGRLRKRASGPTSAVNSVQAERIPPSLHPTQTQLPASGTTNTKLSSGGKPIVSPLTQVLGHPRYWVTSALKASLTRSHWL